MEIQGIPLEKLSIYLSIFNSTVLALIFLYLKFGVDKRLKKYEHLAGEVSELNTKLHDSLVVFRQLVKTTTPLPKRSKDTLQMISSRLKKHDKKASNKITQLLKIWEAGFSEKKAKSGEWEGLQEACYKLMDEIISRVDKLVK